MLEDSIAVAVNWKTGLGEDEDEGMGEDRGGWGDGRRPRKEKTPDLLSIIRESELDARLIQHYNILFRDNPPSDCHSESYTSPLLWSTHPGQNFVRVVVDTDGGFLLNCIVIFLKHEQSPPRHESNTNQRNRTIKNLPSTGLCSRDRDRDVSVCAPH